MIKQSKLKPWHGVIIFAVNTPLLTFIVLWFMRQFSPSVVVQLLFSFFLIIAYTLIAAYVFGGSWRDVFPLAPVKSICPAYLAGSILLALGHDSVLSVTIEPLMNLLPDSVLGTTGGQVVSSMTSAGFLASVVIVPLVSGIGEDALYRGVILSSLRSIKKDWIKVLIIAVMFGIAHGSVARFPATALGGAVFTIAMLRTGNIIIPMALHALGNFAALLENYIVEQNPDSILLATMSGTGYVIKTVILILCFIAGVILLWRKNPDTIKENA